jgi:uncharacterized Zn finger protein
MTSPLASVFDLARIEKLSGVRTYTRALMIQASDIEQLTDRGGRLTARVRGTQPYAVALWVEGTRKAAWSCTCPQGEEGKFCKHAGAVALTMHGGADAVFAAPEEIDATRDDLTGDAVFEFLCGLDHEELARLVYDAASRDPRTAQRVDAKIAASAGRPAVDVKEWRKRITATFGRPSHFVDYREAPSWAAGVGELFDDLRGLLDDGEAASVVPLVEYAFERADRATQYVDSSDGWFGGISSDIASLHLDACRSARPDPAKLAGRLVELERGSELDTFRRAADAYSDVLGPDGLAEYRRLVAPAFDSLGPRSENAWSSERFRLTEAMIGLALAEGDADEVIRIKGRDLRSPEDHREIATALRRAGRRDEAIDWARRGVAMPGRQFQTPALRRDLVELLRENGDAAGAHAVRLEEFQASPSLSSYKDLLAETPEPERDRQRADVLDWLRERAISSDGDRAGSVLVEVLLYEGDAEGAWDAATTVGCDQRWWTTLARAREDEHPADAIPVYQRAVSDLIDKKSSGAYRDAVDLMARIQRLFDATGDPAGWDAYVREITARHRPKSSLMAKLREKGWL